MVSFWVNLSDVQNGRIRCLMCFERSHIYASMSTACVRMEQRPLQAAALCFVTPHRPHPLRWCPMRCAIMPAPAPTVQLRAAAVASVYQALSLRFGLTVTQFINEAQPSCPTCLTLQHPAVGNFPGLHFEVCVLGKCAPVQRSVVLMKPPSLFGQTVLKAQPPL